MGHFDVWLGPDDPLCLQTLEASDNLWPLVQESSCISLPIEDHDINDMLDPSMFLEQENTALADQPRGTEELQEDCLNFHKDDNSLSVILDTNYDNPLSLLQESNMTSSGQDISTEKGLNGKVHNYKTNKVERNNRFNRIQAAKKVVPEEGSVAKKQDHNAQERVRRKNLNASYLALGSVLPDSRKSKKRWSAPVIIDRVLEYIPELENEIEKLALKKNSMLSAVETEQRLEQNTDLKFQAPTVSVHEVKKGEVIIHVCLQRDRKDVFLNLIRNVEAEGLCIKSASTFHICDETVSYDLHVQMEGSSVGADYTAILREKMNSWLC